MSKTLTELFHDHSHFMITAHRGASFEFPENTLLSMEKAVEAGADMIEFDLRGTSDDIPILLHDETIDRTSNGKGRPEDYTLSELKKFQKKLRAVIWEKTGVSYDGTLPLDVQEYGTIKKANFQQQYHHKNL